jgi:hypothetical protein
MQGRSALPILSAKKVTLPVPGEILDLAEEIYILGKPAREEYGFSFQLCPINLNELLVDELDNSFNRVLEHFFQIGAVTCQQ